MADYFINRRTPREPGYAFGVHMEAIGSKPDADGNYPTAEMTGIVHPATASPNFDFTQRDEEDRIHLNQHQLAVAKETGLDPSTLKGDLGYKSNTAEVSHEYLTKNPVGSPPPKVLTDYTYRDFRRRAGINYATAIRDIRKGSEQMFNTTPANAYIMEAYTHSQMRHSVPVMGAYLNQKFGEITVSSNLSPHSSKVVGNLQKKGYPVKHEGGEEEPEVENSIDFDDNAFIASPESRDEMLNSPMRLSKQEVASAKEHFRSLRRGDRPEPKSFGPQFEQLKFPGME